MTRLEKLIAKFKKDPSHLSARDIQKIIIHNGYRQVRIRGSHHIYKKISGPDIIIPLHNNDCKPIYKKQAKSILYPTNQ